MKTLQTENPPIPFFDFYALADCAARSFAEWRTSKHPEPDSAKARQYLRAEPVRAIRYLWKTGDASQRTTVAARVAIWMNRPVKEIMARVDQRENARLA